MKRRALFLLVTAAAALGAWHFSVRARPELPAGPPPRAFLNAAWGMTPAEVAEANGELLEPSVSGRRFYEPSDASERRYKTLETRQHKFFGRPAVVSYTFLDDRLFTYHVFVSDEDADQLDRHMLKYLERKFGKDGTPVDDGSRLKMLWQKDNITANYWFYEDELALSGRFKAVFGVTYKSRERPSPAVN